MFLNSALQFLKTSRSLNPNHTLKVDENFIDVAVISLVVKHNF